MFVYWYLSDLVNPNTPALCICHLAAWPRLRLWELLRDILRWMATLRHLDGANIYFYVRHLTISQFLDTPRWKREVEIFFPQRKYFQRFVKIWKCPVSPVLTPLNISRPSDRLGILRQTWREGDEILGQRVFVSSSPPESKMCSPREMLMRVRLLLHRFHQRKILIYSVVIPTWIWPLSTLLSTLM